MKNTRLAADCRRAWDSAAGFRRRRDTLKSVAYGRPEARRPTSIFGAADTDCLPPATNNLIRRMIKAIIGRWRFLTAAGDGPDGGLREAVASAPALADTDARTLEEFLISGLAVQRLERGRAESVSPERMFFSRFERPDASDCHFMGMLHDMHPSEVCRRFRGGNPGRMAALAALCTGATMQAVPFAGVACDFNEPRSEGKVRVIEVWRRQPLPLLRCHDPLDACEAEGPAGRKAWERLRRINSRRLAEGKPAIASAVDFAPRWSVAWMTADGTMLSERLMPRGAQPPFVVQAYPMIDGEIHSLVEDVTGMQAYVDKLVALLDSVINASAKGVVLYPVDQLPDGLSWRDLREIYSSPGGILPFKRTSKTVMPRQLSSPGTLAGASEMLATQLRLFDEISGIGAFQTGGTAAGADMLRQQREEASVSLLDILSAFGAFTSRRDSMLASASAAAQYSPHKTL